MSRLHGSNAATASAEALQAQQTYKSQYVGGKNGGSLVEEEKDDDEDISLLVSPVYQNLDLADEHKRYD